MLRKLFFKFGANLCFALLVLTSCSKDLTDTQYYEKAYTLSQKGEFDAAIIELKNALQKNASNLKARGALGIIYVELGHGAAAEKELRRAITLGASESTYDMYLAQALFQQNKFSDAYDEFSKNKGLNKKTLSKHNIILARASLGLGKVEQAEQYFAKVSGADKKSIPALYVSTFLALSKHNLTAAEVAVKEILQKDQKEVEAWILKGAIAFEQGDAEAAEVAYNSALSNYRSRQNSSLTFKANTGLFYAQLKLKNYDDALKTSEKLLVMAKDHPLPKYLRGLLAFEQKDYSTAQSYLDEVYSRLPEHLPTQLLLGSIHYINKSYEQANKYLTWVVNQVPSHVQARKMLAATRLHLARSSEALEVLDPLVEKDTDDSQLLAMVAAAAIQSGNLQMGVDYLKRAQHANPDNPSLRGELAKLYMQKGEYDEAIKELDSIKGDQAPQADVLKIMTYLKKKDYAQARKIAQAIHQKKNSAASLTLLAGVELVAGNVAKAKAFLNQALQKDHDFAPALLHLARLELQEGNAVASKNYFQRVRQKHPANTTALMGLAQISERDGDIKSALAYLQEARTKNEKAVVPRLLLSRYYAKTGDIQSALENASEAHKIAPRDATVALSLANVHMANRDTAKAIEILESLQRVQPKAAIVAYELARAYLGAKRFNRARDELNRAISINPKYYQAKIALVRLDIAEGNHDSALREARSLQKLQPKKAIGYLLEGNVFEANSQYAEAEQAFRKSIQVNATPLGYEKVANVLLVQKKLQQAITELKMGVTAFPKATVLQIQLATIYQTYKQIPEAIKVYKKILQEHPNHAVVLNNLALLYLDNGDTHALEYAQKAHSLIPSNPGIADTLGWVYAKQGNLENALPLLERASTQTNMPTIQYHFAYVLYKTGQKIEARRILMQILNGNNDFHERSEAEELLQLLKK